MVLKYDVFYVIIYLDLLQWLVSDEEIIHDVLSGNVLITKQHLKETLHPKLTDTCVQLSCIKEFLNAEAWRYILKFTKKNQFWLCEICCNTLEESQSVGCDGCLNWYHLRCVGKTKLPAMRIWFCRDCLVKNTEIIMKSLKS